MKNLRLQLLETLEQNIENALADAYASENVDEIGHFLDTSEYDALVVTALQNVLAVKRTLVR